MLVFSATLTTLLTALLGPLVMAQKCDFGKIDDLTMRQSCDVTDAVKTFRKHTEACPIDLMNFDWNQSAIPVGISGFTECFDDVCDVTRFPH